ncbi:FYVE zinc finger containing protein [Novymonas esmeraldas]|uniref:FYVE zinc finger containing protein n=1 Tax=Novymonas esmeraldas TaxID=1808958 RepID=A0AAW0ETX5_9TRYP
MFRGTASFQGVPQSQWPIPSTVRKCVQCSKSFGLFLAADNCRGCGRVCCPGCLADHLVLPGHPGSQPVPVCGICAKAISRSHEEAEMAMHRCHLLEEMLNEQAMQSEKLRTSLREQEEENKLLTREKESLKATITRMEIEAEVAAAKAATAASASVSASPAPSPAASPMKLDAGPDPDAAASSQSIAAMEEALNKKRRQLDIREATLKDALKKVSTDATRIADQRAALQDQERQVAAQLTSLFEEERQRLEDICADAVMDVQNKYLEWVAQQQDGALERRRRYEQAMEERHQRVAAEAAETRAERDALRETVEELREAVSRLEAEAEEQLRAGRAELDAARASHADERQAHRDASAGLQQQVQDAADALARTTREKAEEVARTTAAAVSAAESAVRQAERERAATEAELVQRQHREEVEAERRSAAAHHDAAVAAIEAKHQRALDVAAQGADTSCHVERAALQKKCKELEARLETRKAAAWQLQQQLRDAKQELVDLQGNVRDRAEAAAEERQTRTGAVVASVQRCGSVLIKEAQQLQQRMLAEQADSLAAVQRAAEEVLQRTVAATAARDEQRQQATEQLQARLHTALQELSTAREQLDDAHKAAAATAVKHDMLYDVIQRQQRAMQEQQEAQQKTLEELRLARESATATSAAAAAASPDGAQVRQLLHAQQRWVQQQAHLQGLYVTALFAVLQREWTQVMNTTASSLAAETERQRGRRVRNAKALEQTTSTIREVQDDLRSRTQELLQRQSQLEVHESQLRDKKRRVDQVCRSLYTVAQELRKRHAGAADGIIVEEVMRTARVMSDSP